MASASRRTRLSDDQSWAIVCAPADERVADTARRIGAKRSTVASARIHFRKVGFSCPVFFAACPVCGVWLTRRKRPKTGIAVHDACRQAEWERKRWERLSVDERLDRLSRAKDWAAETQAETFPRAYARMRRWTVAEDALVLELMDAPISETCERLGRSMNSVDQRRRMLRKRCVDTDDGVNKDRKNRASDAGTRPG